ncbi:MAG TPA: NADH-quinone oxidoreductase subunit C [Methanoregulaceae archaeon]|nr:NADH-quinone oxidoreductase subunit C [Methanoregulaceae archaeon]
MNQLISIDAVQEMMKGIGTAELVRYNRIRVAIAQEMTRKAVSLVMGPLGCDRLITMSTADNGDTFELIYHLTGPHQMVISLATGLPREKPETESMSDLLPAGIYERQIHDLFGIFFKGNPNMKRIILNEDWPADEFPLRKDWEKGPDTFYGGIKGEKI